MSVPARQVPGAVQTPVQSTSAATTRARPSKNIPQFRDWYCFEYWKDGYRKFRLTSLCKRTKELCEEAQQRNRKPGQSMAPCSFKDKAYCVRMRVHILESDYLDCSETWHQCMARKSMDSSQPDRYQSLSECEVRE